MCLADLKLSFVSLLLLLLALKFLERKLKSTIRRLMTNLITRLPKIRGNDMKATNKILNQKYYSPVNSSFELGNAS